MRATLVGSAGPLIGREFSLDKPVVTIGRRDENDIVIKDPTVSRNHARIRQEGDDLILNDNGSTSGTVVNGVPLTGEHRLRDGDIIVIGGNATFAVQIQPDDEGATIAFSRDQLPGMLPQGEPSDPGLRAARENYHEAGRTSFIPTADLGGNEPPALFEPPPAPPAARTAPVERAPEPPAMGGGYGERAAFPSPPPAPPPAPQYDPEATNILQPPPARDSAPAAGGWAPPTPPPPPAASGAPGGEDLGGDTVSWPAPPRDDLPDVGGWPPPPPRDERPAGGPAGDCRRSSRSRRPRPRPASSRPRPA